MTVAEVPTSGDRKAEEGVYCVEDGCPNLATNDRLVGFANGDPIVELVCKKHGGGSVMRWFCRITFVIVTTVILFRIMTEYGAGAGFLACVLYLWAIAWVVYELEGIDTNWKRVKQPHDWKRQP